MDQRATLRVSRPARLDGLSPVEAAQRLRHLPGFLFFDTSGNLPSGRETPVSVLAARPREILRGSIHNAADRARLRSELARRPTAGIDCGFPMGGLCGWIGYDGGFTFGVYPEMLVYSHADAEWTALGGLAGELSENPAAPATCDPGIGPVRALSRRSAFIRSVRRAKEWIAAGDIYQVNLSQCFEARAEGDLFPLYERLRACSPAPMSAWMSLAGRDVLCSSPETFLRISGRRIETRPIKGTRPRFADPDLDRRSAYELQTSPKEIAELVMITDLLRNDLGQVCEFGSVEVAAMLALEQFEQVHHLVSTVVGTMRDDVDAVGALAACFPGGSITGAPKRRAREIIGELESVPRGLYCGALGYFGFNGESQFNIVIRTAVRENGRLRWHVGAGIVADSSPEFEYEETLHKAEGIRRAVGETGAHWRQVEGHDAPYF